MTNTKGKRRGTAISYRGIPENMKFLLWPQHVQIYKKLCDTVNIKEMTLFKKECPTNVTKTSITLKFQTSRTVEDGDN
eukprot:bmy_04397T0